MTLQQFSKASIYVQHTMVQIHGRMLLEITTSTLYRQLYDVDGFYVEISRCNPSSKIFSIRCYTIMQIDFYLSLVDISPVTDLL
ncbi:MAG: hypothetical protein EOO10_08630 [Chitinophagaceae bacterium]|nr:MAG: hypothetical protein EOO10_08630 [Chitinophagaceae bacterium]